MSENLLIVQNFLKNINKVLKNYFLFLNQFQHLFFFLIYIHTFMNDNFNI